MATWQGAAFQIIFYCIAFHFLFYCLSLSIALPFNYSSSSLFLNYPIHSLLHCLSLAHPHPCPSISNISAVTYYFQHSRHHQHQRREHEMVETGGGWAGEAAILRASLHPVSVFSLFITTSSLSTLYVPSTLTTNTNTNGENMRW